MTDIWGPLGVIVAALAIVVGAWFAWWFARGARILIQVSGTTLVSAPNDTRISGHYGDSVVPRVTQSVVWIWREGRGTVKGSDIVDKDPITLRVPEGDRILDASVVKQTKLTNDVSIDFDPNLHDVASSLGLSFAYLDPRQGAAIEILHTADSPDAITVSGTIMGIPKGFIVVTNAPTVSIDYPGIGVVALTVPTHIVPRHLRMDPPSMPDLLKTVVQSLRQTLLRM
jgi:hypothetical protein